MATLLHDAGVWRSPRQSDGIARVRLVGRGHGWVRLIALVWEIDQTQHTLWLEVRGDADQPRWELRYGVDTSSQRRARNAIDSIAAADDVDWRVTLAGTATVVDGALVPTVDDGGQGRSAASYTRVSHSAAR